jgi:oligopeptide transport system substrate-binding protein
MKNIFLFTLVSLMIVWGMTSCEPTEKTKEGNPIGLTEAKGHYLEGDKKYKIWYGGIFRINEVENFKNLYPHSLTDAISSHIGSQIYQGFFRLNQKTLKVEKCLAEDYTVNEDATVWTMTLRDGVYFHDDACFEGGKGRKVTVDDFKYCFDKLCESYPDNKLYELFQDRVVGAKEYFASTQSGSPLEGGVSGVKVIGNSIEITLSSPFAAFDKVLSHSACWVFPKEAWDKYGSDMRRNCVGTGAFKVDVIKEGVQVRLVRNEKYWESDEHGNQLPYINIIKTTFTQDKKTELSSFQSGKLDMVWKLPVEEMSSVLGTLKEAQNGENTEFQYQQKRGMSTQFYCFLHTSELFSDVRVRKAFNLAINREDLVKYTLQGEGEPGIHGFVPDFGAYDNKTIKGFGFDPEQARELMAESGHTDGKGLENITLYINEGGSTNILLAEAIQNQLRENIGVKINIEPLQMPIHIQKFQTGQEDFWRIAWVADYPDPENFLKLFYGKNVPTDPTAESFPNFSRYTNPEFDAMFERALAEVDDKTRDELFHSCDSLLIADAAFMPIYYDEYIRLLKLNVRAFPQNAMEYRDLSRVFFSRDEE